MFDVLFGLPVHPLLVVTAAALVLVPLSTSSGESLERRVPETALVEAHARIADGLLLPVVVLAVTAAALFWLQRRERHQSATAPRAGRSSSGAPGRPVVMAILVIAAVGAVSTAVQVVRIGHSGAQAAWAKTAQTVPRGGEASGD
jgi:hypothetical protein